MTWRKLTEGFRRWLGTFTRGNALLASLRADRFLLVTTSILSVAVLIPLFVTPFVPLQDLPNHVALASLLSHIDAGGEVSSYHFIPQPYPVPYWVGYMIILLGAKVASPLLGAKLFVATALLAVPLGMIRLLPTLGRSPRLGLWAFALSWDFNLSWGFVAFNLGMGLSFVYLAWAIDSLREPTWRWQQAAKAVGLSVVLALTHAHAAGVAVAALGVLALSELPNWNKALRLMQFTILPFLGLLPWLIMGFASRSESVPVPEELSEIAVSPNAAVRVRHLFEYTLDILDGNIGETLTGICFVILFVIPLLYLAPSRPEGENWRRAWTLYVVAWLLYMILPHTLHWPFLQHFIQQRHATLILLTGLLLPSCDFTGRYAWRVAPGLLAAALAIGGHTWLGYAFGKRTEPFFEIVEAIPEESRVIPILLQRAVPESHRTPLTHFPAYIVAMKGGYIPYLFDTPNLVVRHRQDRDLPAPNSLKPERTSLTKHVPAYDYVLVQGKKKDFIPKRLWSTRGAATPRLTRVKEAGIWRLYKVEEGDSSTK